MDDGSPLELRAGGDGTFDQGRDRWSAYDGWGCADFDENGRLELVTMRAEQSTGGHEVTVTGYTHEGACAAVVTETVTTVADSANPRADLGIPNCTAVE